MSRVRAEEVAHWLREAAEETLPVDSKPVPPPQHQHAQHPDQPRHLGVEDDGSPD